MPAPSLLALSIERHASKMRDHKVPGDVRLTFESGNDLLAKLCWQCDQGRIFLRLWADCLQRLVRRSTVRWTYQSWAAGMSSIP
jgi:hypothetical protein